MSGSEARIYVLQQETSDWLVVVRGLWLRWNARDAVVGTVL